MEQNERTQYSQAIQEYQERSEAAYEAVKREYERNIPRPEKRKDTRFIRGMIILMLAAATIVSSSRTFAEFGGGIIGGSAVIAIEAGMVGYAFFRTFFFPDKDRILNIKKMVARGLILTLSISLAANFDNVVSLHVPDGIGIEIMRIVVNVLLALGLPMLVFTGGDLLAIIDVWTRKEHEEAVRTWDAGLMEAWERRKAALGVSTKALKATTMMAIPERVSVSDTSQTQGATAKIGPGVKAALLWFEQHPEAWQTPPRRLVADIGQSFSTINRAQRLIAERGESVFSEARGYANGHGEVEKS